MSTRMSDTPMRFPFNRRGKTVNRPPKMKVRDKRKRRDKSKKKYQK